MMFWASAPGRHKVTRTHGRIHDAQAPTGRLDSYWVIGVKRGWNDILDRQSCEMTVELYCLVSPGDKKGAKQSKVQNANCMGNGPGVIHNFTCACPQILHIL